MRRPTRALRILLPAALLAAALSAPFSRADWLKTDESVPLERLLKNVSAHVAEHPDDPKGHYVLGRIHSLAFAHAADAFEVVPAKEPSEGENPGLPDFACYSPIRVKPSRTEFPPESLEHLKKSVLHYRRSVSLDPSQGLVFLGLGWILEVGSRFATDLGSVPGKEVALEDLAQEERGRLQALVTALGDDSFEAREKASRELAASVTRAVPVLLAARDHEDPEVRSRTRRLLVANWTHEALSAYRASYALNIEGDLKRGSITDFDDFTSAISIEAGEGILRLLGEDGNPETAAEIERVRGALATLNEKPRKITPLLFPLGEGRTLESLLAGGPAVAFDLDGKGTGTRWPWVGSDAGLLVWDPEGSGRVRSGRQLFGSVTWWMFWPDGYAPLRALDDDRDGWLRGPELAGIAVWRDANGNGVSDPGEVIPAEAAGVKALAAFAAGTAEGVPFHPEGVLRADGRRLPSFDWTPTSLPREEGD